MGFAGLAVDGTPMKITSVGGDFPASSAQTFLEVNRRPSKFLQAMAVEIIQAADGVDNRLHT